MSYRAFKFIVSGKVQGVYYRAFTKNIAHDTGVVGWVANDTVSAAHCCRGCLCLPRGVSPVTSLAKRRVVKVPWTDCTSSLVAIPGDDLLITSLLSPTARMLYIRGRRMQE